MAEIDNNARVAEGDAQATADRTRAASEVIGGDELAVEPDEGPTRTTDPDLEPIHGGDVSDTPAAQSGTRGAGTGADMGTGAELGTTLPTALADNENEEAPLPGIL